MLTWPRSRPQQYDSGSDVTGANTAPRGAGARDRGQASAGHAYSATQPMPGASVHLSGLRRVLTISQAVVIVSAITYAAGGFVHGLL
jgi:hypothetical protein